MTGRLYDPRPSDHCRSERNACARLHFPHGGILIMRTVTFNVYTFKELETDCSKENARNWFRQVNYEHYSDEVSSIKDFCDYFGVELQYSIDPWSPIDYSTDAKNSNFRGVCLRNFQPDCMPSSTWIDCELWTVFYERFKATGDAKGAFDSALHAGLSVWQKEMEYRQSDEYIDEMLEVNAYEFYADGSILK